MTGALKTGIQMKPCMFRLATAVLFFASFLVPAAANATAQGVHIVNTPHNLSTSGGGGQHDIKASDETQVCVFCHTPHHATTEGPLWSRKSNLTIYIPYASPTIKSNPQQPMGDSRLCLSCHDGTVALGLLTSDYRVSTLGPLPAPDPDPKKNSNLGTDLSTSHPISMTYGLSPEFYDKALLPAKGITLAEGTYVECTSCHDPHNNQYGNFLVSDTSVQHDALCKDCHNKDGWSNLDSTHRTGGFRYAPSVTVEVAADGCRNCHLPHSAQRGVHLLKQDTALAGEQSNCVSVCHKGVPYSNGTSTDIASQLALLYTHPVQNYPGIHVENEPLPVTGDRKHVQCVDCHNPHQSGWQGSPLGSATPDVTPASTAPAVNGPLRGVRGLDLIGNAIPGDGSARYEYEVCFRCHLGSSATNFIALSAQRPVRQFQSYDESLRFAAANPSYHPVTSDTVGRTGRSLLTTYQNTQYRIYCSDCHAPHGSNEPHILRAQNLDSFPSPALDYPLCFTCHDRQFLLDPTHLPHSGSAAMHLSHVRDHSAPCAACHDPHGTPVLRGATTTNAAHLVNFDTRYTGVTPLYNSGARSCTVNGTCHPTTPTQTY